MEFGHSVVGDLGPRERMQLAPSTHQLEISMADQTHEAQIDALVDRPSETREAISEVSLLMSYRQLDALEKAASGRGMTIANLLRRLIGNWLADADGRQAHGEPVSIDTAADEGSHGMI